MQVNTGSAKGRKLKSVPGTTTRPITDRAKQAIFNILMGDVQGSRWLDLFAGTGAVGIEALSRGAREVVFIDNEPLALRTIQHNLAACQLTERAQVLRYDAFAFLRAQPGKPFDFIYVAPPQYRGLWLRALMGIDENIEWLTDEGSVIVQLDPREFTPVALRHLALGDQRRYGKTMLLFYDRV